MGSDRKAEVFFKKLDKSTSFQQWLRKIRKQFGIPLSGFKTTKKASEWLWNTEDEGMIAMFKRDGRYEKFQAYSKAKEELLNEFSIPPSFAATLDGKILYAQDVKQNDGGLLPFGCVLIDPRDQEYMHVFQPEEYWKASRVPHATLLIHAGATKSGINDYVVKNWHRIQELIEGNTKTKRIRANTKEERDKVIFELCSKSSKELGVKGGLNREYRIKQILFDDHRIRMSESNIKRICAEQRRIRS